MFSNSGSNDWKGGSVGGGEGNQTFIGGVIEDPTESTEKNLRRILGNRIFNQLNHVAQSVLKNLENRALQMVHIFNEKDLEELSRFNFQFEISPHQSISLLDSMHVKEEKAIYKSKIESSVQVEEKENLFFEKLKEIENNDIKAIKRNLTRTLGPIMVGSLRKVDQIDLKELENKALQMEHIFKIRNENQLDKFEFQFTTSAGQNINLLNSVCVAGEESLSIRDSFSEKLREIMDQSNRKSVVTQNSGKEKEETHEKGSDRRDSLNKTSVFQAFCEKLGEKLKLYEDQKNERKKKVREATGGIKFFSIGKIELSPEDLVKGGVITKRAKNIQFLQEVAENLNQNTCKNSQGEAYNDAQKCQILLGALISLIEPMQAERSKFSFKAVKEKVNPSKFLERALELKAEFLGILDIGSNKEKYEAECKEAYEVFYNQKSALIAGV